MKGKINGIIFDLDGTLLDSFSVRVDSWHRALYLNGADVDRSKIEPLIGLPGISLASIFSNRPDKVESDEEILFKERLWEVGFFPDVIPTLAKIEGMGIKWVIVTSARREFVDMLPIAGEKVITIDDVKNGKPETEAYEKAAEMMKIKHENIMVVGDSINDMIPAKKLGMFSVLVTHGMNRGINIRDVEIKEIGELMDLL